ncbi:hypothetical protein ACHAXT_012465 [Thalassiosira profunda]
MPPDPPSQERRHQNGSGQKKDAPAPKRLASSRSNDRSHSDRSSRASRRRGDLSGSLTSPAHTSAAAGAAARQQAFQQRRRPTNYTSSYTPPANLAAIASKARASERGSSLDRSEGDGDERRRHLKSSVPEGMKAQVQQWHSHHEQMSSAAKRQQQELQQLQALKQLHKKQHRQHREESQRRPSKEQQPLQTEVHRDQAKAERRGSGQRSGSSRTAPSGASSSRRSSQEQQHVPSPESDRKKHASSSRHSQAKSSSRRSSEKTERQASEEERAEQQRIEEYAGKRAMMRLEKELADHSESRHASSGDESVRSVMDRRKLARVPQVTKSDLIIGEYLGRGNFCDVFEVTWILPEQRMMQSWTSGRTTAAMTYEDSEESLTEGTNMEASMESLALSCSNDLNLLPEPSRGFTRQGSRRAVSQLTTSFHSRGTSPAGPGTTDPLRNSLTNPATGGLRNPNVLALKCLRPAVRAQPRKFVIGAEDLAHETALLACLDHPNIIQLYGRAAGCFSTAFQMRSKGSSSGSGSKPESGQGKQMSNEGYFIILDRLMNTLDNRIGEWKDECRAVNGVAPADGSPVQMPPEGTLRELLCKRVKVAYCIADALEYLHSRQVVFRDLKPANVGFDCNDCVKMFDFGFATSIAPLLTKPYEGYGPLTETCGTRRYMAPEVALKLGYGKEVDVYSFGMLLWEICALDKPFEAIQSVDEFHDTVVLCGRRPSLNIDPLWTSSLKNMMCRCWSTDPLDRPTMAQVKAMLCHVLRDMNKAMAEEQGGSSRGGGSRQQRQEQNNFMNKWRRRVSI